MCIYLELSPIEHGGTYFYVHKHILGFFFSDALRKLMDETPRLLPIGKHYCDPIDLVGIMSPSQAFL